MTGLSLFSIGSAIADQTSTVLDCSNKIIDEAKNKVMSKSLEGYISSKDATIMGLSVVLDSGADMYTVKILQNYSNKQHSVEEKMYYFKARPNANCKFELEEVVTPEKSNNDLTLCKSQLKSSEEKKQSCEQKAVEVYNSLSRQFKEIADQEYKNVNESKNAVSK
jgi:hypothetical protein